MLSILAHFLKIFFILLNLEDMLDYLVFFNDLFLSFI